ncbi:SPO22-domain-containing protein [Mollisia scopiformis]|uniref:SPO22-domain-containing protein n=1 Tax=Mollisia scopiformis TaxID=149040 RepID=A0A194XEP0_MOLSC|nr:SPO22-domain-containing protein [Mollisia scopiformis]KUJ18222.1 SPO22-domain-containing protein [Mollisia scopiformis]
MAPVQHHKDKRVKAILTFASELESQLPKAVTSTTSGPLLHELEKNIAKFPEKLTSSTTSEYEELDRCGTTIWNVCTRLRREYDPDKPHDVPLILLVARVYAFLLLDGAFQSGKSDPGNLPRLMKSGLKAGKTCLDRKQSDLAVKVLEKVAGYETLLKSPRPAAGQEDGESFNNLIAEYYVLRTALAWHKGQFPIAETMYQKSISSQHLFDPQTAESLADVIYEMGKDQLAKKDYPLASKWLDRSYKFLNLQELDKLSIDANELRISIIESLIKALLGLQSPESYEQARNLVILLETELGDKLIVLLLKLDLLSAPTPEPFDSASYSDVLQRMTRTMYLNDSNFRLIMFHIRKLKDKSPSLACKALDDLLTLRLLKAEELQDSWIGKTIVTRLWTTVNQRDSPEALQSLYDLFETITANLTKPMASDATLAAHTLFWKHIESNYVQGQYDIAESWCRLALHRLFSNSGEINTARLSRKLLLCSLARKDFGSAREVFHSMSNSARNEPMSRFLMYKIAVRGGDTELATECLHFISTAARTTHDLTLLYGCVLDAQSIGDKTQTLAGLQLVLEKSDYGAQSAVHVPSLLRLTISLSVALLEEHVDTQDIGTIERICAAIEKGATAIRKARGSLGLLDPPWTIDELEWFSKNSYNLAIKHLSNWEPRYSLRILQSSLDFMDQYPRDLSDQVSEDLSLRKMFCAFSAATALISLARAEDNIENQMQDYLGVRKHVENFDTLLQEKVDSMNEDMEQDLRRKLSILAAFDFEAACRLKAWNDLGEAVLQADACKSAQVYEIMADIILCSDAPTAIRINILKNIINGAWSLDSLNATKLAKYMRCLFQIAISDNPDIAEQLLDQIQNHAEDAAESEQPYPSEELEWVATKAFNHAVDLYCTGDDENCKNWAGRALNIAHYVNDEGNLEKLLQSKLLGLKFDS